MAATPNDGVMSSWHALITGLETAGGVITPWFLADYLVHILWGVVGSILFVC